MLPEEPKTTAAASHRTDGPKKNKKLLIAIISGVGGLLLVAGIVVTVILVVNATALKTHEGAWEAMDDEKLTYTIGLPEELVADGDNDVDDYTHYYADKNADGVRVQISPMGNDIASIRQTLESFDKGESNETKESVCYGIFDTSAAEWGVALTHQEFTHRGAPALRIDGVCTLTEDYDDAKEGDAYAIALLWIETKYKDETVASTITLSAPVDHPLAKARQKVLDSFTVTVK